MTQPIQISKKICMLGSFGVGKTSLVRQFVYQKYEEKYFSTIGVQITQKLLQPLNSSNTQRIEQLKLIIWDLAHIEKFDSVIKNYFRGAHGAIVVFDVTRPHSFEKTNIYLKPFLETNPKSKLIFVGNKVDLIKPEKIEMEQFLRISGKYQSEHILTSAKTGENVEELFLTLGKSLIEKG